MTDLEAALAEAAEALEACSIPYVLIGGLAVAAWGEARSTLDVDLSVWADPERLPDAVACLCGRLRPLSGQPLALVERARVLPVQSSAGIRLDIIFGALPIERDAIARAVFKPIAGRAIPVASVEDLLLMKLVSERPKDVADSRALLRRYGKTIDRQFLLPVLTELAEALSQPDILVIFNEEQKLR